MFGPSPFTNEVQVFLSLSRQNKNTSAHSLHALTNHNLFHSPSLLRNTSPHFSLFVLFTVSFHGLHTHHMQKNCSTPFWLSEFSLFSHIRGDLAEEKTWKKRKALSSSPFVICYNSFLQHFFFGFCFLIRTFGAWLCCVVVIKLHALLVFSFSIPKGIWK